jgi:pimeloyl-ACP methyl ester carboxylesterase
LVVVKLRMRERLTHAPASFRLSDLPFIDIPSSPLAQHVAPVRIRYRDTGAGPPVVVLHGGWGYEMYPFDRQIAALAPGHRVVIPDRSGYGGSQPIDDLPTDFHQRAAGETRALIDALDLPRPIIWGHSDGAIIALLLGLAAPQRIAGAIVEATHLYKRKPGSRPFFEAIIAGPESVGARAAAALARDHGERWREIVDWHSRAWLRIADEARSASEDFYGGRLGELQIPVLVVHGATDPRTEPGELEALCAALRQQGAGRPAAETGNHRAFAIFDAAGHSPHSERATADAVTDAALSFVRDVIGQPDPAHRGRPVDPARPLP